MQIGFNGMAARTAASAAEMKGTQSLRGERGYKKLGAIKVKCIASAKPQLSRKPHNSHTMVIGPGQGKE